MEEPLWLDRSVLEAIHSDLVREHGGSFGIRDAGLIDSALGRPRQKWTYDRGADLATLAAAYGFGLAKNHGFVDGNKRVALMAIYTFLLVNGFELEVPEPQAVDIMVAVASGRMSEDALATWIRQGVVPSTDADDA